MLRLFAVLAFSAACWVVIVFALDYWHMILKTLNTGGF